MELLFENNDKTTKLWHEPAQKIILAELIGKVSTDDYKQLFNLMLEKGKEGDYNKLIFNNLELKKDTAVARAWFVSSFMPQAYQIFGKGMNIALIQPSNFLLKMAIKVMVSTAQAMGLDFKIGYFKRLKDALEN